MKRKLFKLDPKKETYKKKEVEKILNDFEKRLSSQLLEDLSNNINLKLNELKLGQDYYFRIDPYIIDSDKKTSFREELFHKFNDNDFFKGKTKSSSFVRVFSGAEAKKEDPISIVNWKFDNEAMYFLYCLGDLKVIDDKFYAKKANMFFDIPERNAYAEYGKFKKGIYPQRHEIIERYIKEALERVWG